MPNAAATKHATNMSSSDTDDDVIVTGMLPAGAVVKEQKRKKQKLIKEVSGHEWIEPHTKHVTTTFFAKSQTPRNWPSIVSEFFCIWCVISPATTKSSMVNKWAHRGKWPLFFLLACVEMEIIVSLEHLWWRYCYWSCLKAIRAINRDGSNTIDIYHHVYANCTAVMIVQCTYLFHFSAFNRRILLNKATPVPPLFPYME